MVQMGMFQGLAPSPEFHSFRECFDPLTTSLTIFNAFFLVASGSKDTNSGPPPLNLQGFGGPTFWPGHSGLDGRSLAGQLIQRSFRWILQSYWR